MHVVIDEFIDVEYTVYESLITRSTRMVRHVVEGETAWRRQATDKFIEY